MKFDISYSMSTGASRDEGDTEENGWEHRDLSLSEALYFFEAESKCDFEADHWPLDAAQLRWISASGNEDYTTDRVYNYALHMPDCVTASSRKRIARLFGMK